MFFWVFLLIMHFKFFCKFFKTILEHTSQLALMHLGSPSLGSTPDPRPAMALAGLPPIGILKIRLGKVKLG
jgi:hypothetical protein